MVDLLCKIISRLHKYEKVNLKFYNNNEMFYQELK